MAESAKRHEKNSNIIKEIRASTDAAIRNQGASIKTLEIQIGQISKVLQEGIGGLSSSTKPNPRDYVKSISTAKANSSSIRRIGSGPYAEAREVMILETYDHTLPQKKEDPGSFTLPCFIHNICFDKALVDLGASVSAMPFSTYSNLSLGEAINESFDPLYGNYIELNDLDMPLEPRMNQDDFEPTLDFINEPTYKSCYKMKFSCIIGYKHVNAGFLPSLSINIMTKHFYNSIINYKGDHEGKNLAGTLIDIPIFVGNFSIISGFSITNDVDITSGVVLGMPFCKKFVSCQKIMEIFAHGDECEQIDE
ncbi:hypothetical protein Tco_0505776 [Tanacetum coccineum]